MRSFSAVIFDMDGVLVDSEPLHQRAFETLFAEMGKTEDHGVVFSDYYGRSDRALLVDFIQNHNLPFTLDSLKKRKLEFFLQYLREHRPIFEELHRLIPELALRFPLAIASSNTRHTIDIVLEISGFRPYFQTIVSLDDIRAPKPDPDVYLKAASRLGISPSQCIAVEDAAAGVTAAKDAGMSVVAITTSLPREKLTEADWIVEDHEELGEFLLSGATDTK